MHALQEAKITGKKSPMIVATANLIALNQAQANCRTLKW